MKKCPHCQAEVEDNFDLCWNCQYSFTDNRVIASNEFEEICPKCHAPKDANTRKCKNCGYKINPIAETNPDGTGRTERKLDCLRCAVPMNFAGNQKFHEGTRMGVFGDLFELFTNRESFDVYTCPNCGKVEFFLPN